MYSSHYIILLMTFLLLTAPCFLLPTSLAKVIYHIEIESQAVFRFHTCASSWLFFMFAHGHQNSRLAGLVHVKLKAIVP
jgi:hypothetical protein